jgi:hypothetical protein
MRTYLYNLIRNQEHEILERIPVYERNATNGEYLSTVCIIFHGREKGPGTYCNLYGCLEA